MGIYGLPRQRAGQVDPAHFPVNTVPTAGRAGALYRGRCAPNPTWSRRVVKIPPGMCTFSSTLRTELYRAAKGALSLQAGGLRPQLDRGRHAPHRLLQPTFLRPLHLPRAGGQQRRPLDTAGTALTFELQPAFLPDNLVLRAATCGPGGDVVLLLRLRLRRAEGEFRAVLRRAQRIAREIHDTLAQGYVGISVQLEVLAELLRQRQDGGRGKASGPDARLRSRRAGRSAAVDLGAGAHRTRARPRCRFACAAWWKGRQRSRDWNPN